LHRSWNTPVETADPGDWMSGGNIGVGRVSKQKDGTGRPRFFFLLVLRDVIL